MKVVLWYSKKENKSIGYSQNCIIVATECWLSWVKPTWLYACENNRLVETWRPICWIWSLAVLFSTNVFNLAFFIFYLINKIKKIRSILCYFQPSYVIHNILATRAEVSKHFGQMAISNIWHAVEGWKNLI